MVANQAFKDATNFLRKSGTIKKLNEIADKLGIDQKLFAKYRHGSPKIYLKDSIVKDLIRIYPETKRFFEHTETAPDSTDTLKSDIELLAVLREALADKRKIIASLEAQVDKLKTELEESKALHEGRLETVKTKD